MLAVQFGDFRDRLIASEENALKLARQDNLTGLINRRHLYELFDKAKSLAYRYKRPLLIIFIDLNDFKKINDSLGHESGDWVLTKVARRLNSLIRESDIVSRIGGDEFAIVAHECETQKQVDELINRIRTHIAKPIQIQSKEYSIDVSIGIAKFPDDGMLLDQLLSIADKQMYAEKQAHKLSGK